MVPLSMPTSRKRRLISLLFNLYTFNSSRRSRLSNRISRQFSSFRPFTNVILVRISRFRIGFSRVSISILRRIRQQVHQSRVVRRRHSIIHVRLTSNTFRFKRIPNRNTFNSFHLRRPGISVMFIRRSNRHIHRVRLISIRRKSIRKGQRRVTTLAFPAYRRPSRKAPCRRIRSKSLSNLFRRKGRPTQECRAVFKIIPARRHLNASSNAHDHVTFKLRMRTRLIIIRHAISLIRHRLQRGLINKQHPTRFQYIDRASSFLSPHPVHSVRHYAMSK